MKKTTTKKQPKPWYKQKFNITLALTIIIVTLAYKTPFLHPLFDAFADYFKAIWWAMLLGLILGGIIDHLIPRQYIAQTLAKPEKKTILNATLLGFLMSACSHGILAIAIQLYKKGASIPAVIAFLLASPWANLPITLILFSFFGIKALALIFGAILIAITTGLIYQVLENNNLLDKENKPQIKDINILKDIKKRWKNYKPNIVADTKGVLLSAWKLNKMVTWWILIGMLAASAARAYVPTHFFQQYMGTTLLGMLIVLIFATVLEVCSEGSSPIAFEIYNQTGALGNSFLFLMAGVSTDYTEIGLLWANIGKRTALWLPVVTVPQIMLLGYLFNLLL